MEVDNDLDCRDSQPGQILGRNERCHDPKKLIVCVSEFLSMKEKSRDHIFSAENINIKKILLKHVVEINRYFVDKSSPSWS